MELKEPQWSAENVCVLENQRYYPVVGWSTKLLPTDCSSWCNEDGKKLTKDEAEKQLPAGWRWLGGWKVVVVDLESKHPRDLEGWSYAIDFPAAEWTDAKKTQHFVRRRKWVRRRTNQPDKRQFGVALELAECTEVPGYASPIPTVLVTLRKHLLAGGGLEQVGIFRMECDAGELQKAKDEMNQDAFTGSKDVHVIANLIKLWFRELPSPLLASIENEELPSSPLHGGDNPSSSLSFVGTVLTTIPEPGKSAMEYLLDICVKVVGASHTNRMTAEALANIFTPLLMHPPTDRKSVV